MPKTELLTFEKMGEIAEKAGEERSEKIKTAISESFSGIRDKAEQIGNRILGAPEAIQAQASAVEKRVSEIVDETTEKVTDKWEGFLSRVEAAKNDLVEKWGRGKERAINKAKEFGVRAVKVGLTPLAYIEDKASHIYDIPEAIHNYSAGSAERKAAREEARQAKLIEIREKIQLGISKLFEGPIDKSAKSQEAANERYSESREKAEECRVKKEDFRKIGKFLETF